MPTISSRFAVAVHVLAYMTWRRSEPATSERVAASVNTNPVVVRRILGALRNAGMVTAQPGVGGGAQFAREPERITLLDVYRAVEGDELFALHAQPPCRQCDVGGNIQGVLHAVFARASAAMEAELDRVTIRDVFESVAERVRRERCPQAQLDPTLRRQA
jgi:Rrf2 family protein